jgi:hypothetical protein
MKSLLGLLVLEGYEQMLLGAIGRPRAAAPTRLMPVDHRAGTGGLKTRLD